MTEKSNKAKSLDFAPDLNPSKENLSKKTSVNFNKRVAEYINKQRCLGMHVSTFINKVIEQHMEVEANLQDDVYGTLGIEVVPVKLLLHKDMAVFLQTLIDTKGALHVANKLAEVVQYNSDIMNGTMTVFGHSTLERALANYVRSLERIQDDFRCSYEG